MEGRFHVPVALYILLSLSNVLVVVNSSVNFIVYCVVENTFREELFKLLKKAYNWRIAVRLLCYALRCVLRI